MYTQIDDYGQTSTCLSRIIDFRLTPEVVPNSRGWTTLPSGVRKIKVITKGVKLEILCVDGSSSWIPLKDLKESNSIETVEFSVSRSIQDQPAFAWWVTHVDRKHNAIIKQVQARTAKRGIKFGIMVPNDIANIRRLDKENRNDF